MRLLIQRVKQGSVSVDGTVIGSVGAGLVIFVGVTHEDSEKDAEYLAVKAANLRIFCDDEGKMNRSLLDVGGEALVVSQFTLYGDCVKGRRPGFDAAAEPVLANRLYEKFMELLKAQGVRKVPSGRFGADMLVKIDNDGPVTFMLESRRP